MRQALLATTAIIGVLAVKPAFADDAVLKQLKEMQTEMSRMKSEISGLKKQLAEAKGGGASPALSKSDQKFINDLKAAKASKAPESDVKISMVPAPKIETADGAYSFKVGGFAQVDGGMFSDDRRDHPDGTNIRRARLNVSGTIARDFNYKLENDFAGNASAITDAYLEYVGLKPFSFMVGQFKEPFGLETLTSDLFTTFIERSSVFAFSPDRKIGFAVSANNHMDGFGYWTATVGGFGSGTASTTSTDDEPRDLTGRLTWAPIAEKTEALHFGIAGSLRIPDSNGDSMTFSSRAENQLSTATADLTVNTGSITAIDSVNLLGLETAGVYGPASLQGEYVRADVNRHGALADQTFDGYYVEASYFLTGESRNYLPAQGKFDRVKPMWNFNPKEGNWGAWQVAARYSNLDLNDNVIHGGQMKDTTLSLRFIPHPNLSFMANYIMVNTDGFATTANDDPDIFLLRAQFDF